VAGQRDLAEGEHVQGGIGKAMKRRGILAAAGAVVAGIAAKQASQPVAAANGDPVVLGSLDNLATTPTAVQNAQNDTAPALLGVKGGVQAQTTPAFGAGLMGLAYTGSNIGVYGETGIGAGAGVRGRGSNWGGYGVYGETVTHSGVDGGSQGGIGVYGASNNIGVQGVIVSAFPNTVAVQGANQSSGAGGYGVQGTSASSHGVVGEGGNNQGSGGVVGIARNAGTVGFQALAVSPATYAGYFVGDVSINGNLGVTGSKFAVVKGADSKYRGMYAVESPECWFEDFGTGTLTNGTADIKLDPLFAQHVHTDQYHVFLTENGGTHHHLAVDKQAAGGFAVSADAEVAALKGKKAADLSGTFSYRIVAKRNDIAGERLPLWEMPTAPAIPPPPAPLPEKKPHQ
jgi:hypothetical protein